MRSTRWRIPCARGGGDHSASGGCVRGLRHAGQLDHAEAEPAVGDPLRGEAEQTEGGEEGQHPWLAELQTAGELAVRGLAGEHEGGELRLTQAAVMGDLLGGHQADVDALP